MLIRNEFKEENDEILFEYFGLTFGQYNCLIILAGLAIGLRFISLFFLKVMVKKF